MNKYLRMLEFNKIIELLKKELVLNANIDRLDNMQFQEDLKDIELALNEVDEAVILQQRMGRNPIYFNVDLSLILSKVSKSGVLSEEEVLAVGQLLDTIKDHIIYYEKLEAAGINGDFFKLKLDLMEYYKDLNLNIKKIITPYGEIKDDASILLRDIRKQQLDTEKNINSKLQEIVSKNLSKLSSNIVSIRNNRFVIPVKNDFKNSIKGIIHDQSASGETVFIEPLIINQLNNKLNQLKQDENNEIYNILRKISIEINEFYDGLMLSYKTILDLDIIFAKANYAIKINANKPIVNKDGIVDLLNARHPLLNVDIVVPNNISIGKDYKGIIITGPNTGGKTVLLKTLGLLALFVKAGMLIPADANSKMMIFDNVFVDIGDEQSIDQNLSTFSSHLKNVIDIIDLVTPNSLVLLDELGSGTDPVEGSSLAISIFDYLIKRDCLIIATSHYSELKMHAYNSDNVINASVEFNEITLKPTYRLLIGVPGMSNALKIARNLGLNSEIIYSAENYVHQKNDDLSNMLDKLIKQSHELDHKINDLTESRKLVNQKVIELDETKAKILSKEQNIIDKAMNEINELLNDLKELKNREIKPHEIADVTYKVRELSNIQIEEKIIEEDKNIEVNSIVYVSTYGTNGTVTKVLNNNKFEVLLGNATIRIDRKYLKLAKTTETPIVKSTGINVTTKASVSSTLDLRGKRFEEAKDLIDKFLDDAIYANFNTVSIIHGFGTGVIRKLVIDELKANKNVESYRYGGAGEGGQGVTIAIMKQ